MNCQSFNSMLHEYLDETLGPRDQSAAQEHVQHCPTCRRALEGRRHLAKTMRVCFETATYSLALRPDLRRNVLQALESKPQPSALVGPRRLSLRHWSAGFHFGIRHSSLAAILLTGLLLALFLQHRIAKNSASQTIAQSASPIIDVPLPAQTYMFRRQNGTVMDTLSITVGQARAGVPDGGRPIRKP